MSQKTSRLSSLVDKLIVTFRSLLVSDDTSLALRQALDPQRPRGEFLANPRQRQGAQRQAEVTEGDVVKAGD
jgi:hypothetical protein